MIALHITKRIIIPPIHVTHRSLAIAVARLCSAQPSPKSQRELTNTNPGIHAHSTPFTAPPILRGEGNCAAPIIPYPAYHSLSSIHFAAAQRNAVHRTRNAATHYRLYLKARLYCAQFSSSQRHIAFIAQRRIAIIAAGSNRSSCRFTSLARQYPGHVSPYC